MSKFLNMLHHFHYGEEKNDKTEMDELKKEEVSHSISSVKIVAFCFTADVFPCFLSCFQPVCVSAATVSPG